MGYQDELICNRCGAKGTIRKVKRKRVLSPNDEMIHFMCTSCKAYASCVEAISTNADELPYLLEEDWEWGSQEDIKEKVKEEDIIDMSVPSEQSKKAIKSLPKKMREEIEKMWNSQKQET